MSLTRWIRLVARGSNWDGGTGSAKPISIGKPSAIELLDGIKIPTVLALGTASGNVTAIRVPSRLLNSTPQSTVREYMADSS